MIDINTIIITGFKTVKTVSDLIELAIKYLDSNVDTIFREIANVHYNSAIQAFHTAKQSSTLQTALTETQVAIGHLRDSYNFIDRYCNQATTRFLIIEKKLNDSDKYYGVKQKLDIALLIALSYKKIGEKNNFITWHEISKRELIEYENLYRKQIDNWSMDYNEESIPSGYALGGKIRNYYINEHKRQDYLQELRELKYNIMSIN